MAGSFSYTTDSKTGRPLMFGSEATVEQMQAAMDQWSHDPNRPLLVRDLQPITALLTEIRDLLKAGAAAAKAGE